MKYLLVLPGNSVKNRAWGETCLRYFQEEFDVSLMQEYAHWENGKAELDMEAELESLRKMMTGMNPDVEWYIFAKSIGSVLALKAIEQGILTPKKCVFFGMSLNIAAELYGEEFSYLTAFNRPALAFHNDADPVADYAYVSAKLAEFAPTITLKTLSGNTHDYLDFAMCESDVQAFLGS
jgi:hypothetical protein